MAYCCDNFRNAVDDGRYVYQDGFGWFVGMTQGHAPPRVTIALLPPPVEEKPRPYVCPYCRESLIGSWPDTP